MTYRTAEDRPELNEREAWELARAYVGFPLYERPTEYAWGWVFNANTTAVGPGPVSVTRRGEVISHGSLPMTFSDSAPPVDRFQRKASWMARLGALLFGRRAP